MAIKKFNKAAFLIILLGWVNSDAHAYINHQPHDQSDTIDQEPYESKIFRVDGIPDLTVLTVSGDIEVVHNPDIDHVLVELYVKRGYRLLSGRNNIRNYRIIINQRGNQINATVERRRGDQSWFSENLDFTFQVQAPKELISNLRTMNGSISIQGATGNQIVHTNSGNISIGEVEGQVQANSAGGNVNVTDSAGQFNLRTVAGNIEVQRIRGEVRARTTSGNINMNNIDGTLVCATASGNIDANFTAVTHGVHAESASGNISLELPGNMGYRLDVRGSSINLDQLGPFDGTIRGRSASGQIGDGMIPVQISTASGRVVLMQNNRNP